MSEMTPAARTASDGLTIPALELLVDVLASVDQRGDDHDSFYSGLASAVCSLGGMKRAVIFRYDDATRRVRAVGAHDFDIGVFAGANITVESAPVAARALIEDRVIEVAPPEPHVVAPEFSELVGDHTLVYVPIAAAGRWPGLVLAEPLPENTPLDDARRDLLWALGKTLALASIARIATFHGERARQLEERIDLARDIHDRVVQRLFGVSLVLSGEGALADGVRRRAAEEVQIALQDLRAALQRPLGRAARVTGTTLAAELDRLAAEHPDLGLRVEGEIPPVPPDLEPLAQSVLTEAVRNARKHARVTSISVRATRDNGVFVLEVENDGVVERPRAAPPGMGLRLAALEAIHAGGLVEFGERQAGVWQVRLAVPEGASA